VTAHHRRTHDIHAKEDRLELLLFSLHGRQRFGINVLKVKEVIPCPHLTIVPQAHPAVRGVTHLRGRPLTVIDLAQAVGRPPLPQVEGNSVIVTELNRSQQGFLVGKVDRIVVCDWSQVLPPPSGTGLASYITGVTRVDEELVQVLDVERVLGEVVEIDTATTLEGHPALHDKRVLVVDDSLVARSKTAQTLSSLGIDCLMARDGREALEELKRLGEEKMLPDMVISDIEMPEMDGYSLTRELRAIPALADIYVLLHTSLNGAINTEKAHRVGANDFLTKFVPEDLAHAVIKGLLGQGAQEP